jgi:hypothetical protein
MSCEDNRVYESCMSAQAHQCHVLPMNKDTEDDEGV